MTASGSMLVGFAAALGGGLLIGIERERRKGAGPRRAPAGVRTFTLAALAGAGAQALTQPMLVAAAALFIAVLASIAYWRNRTRDPGVTTELALFVTYLIGVLAMEHPAVAAGGSVIVALLLASRSTLHNFSVDVLTSTELRDGLLFAAAALIMLPLLPNQPLPWTLGINPRRLWGLVVLIMALQAAGYVASRAAGPRLGLSLSGLATGFVSSTGTIAALGARAREKAELRTSCVAGALFSTVATVVLLGVVVLTVYPSAMSVLWPSLLCALVTAAAAAAVPLWRQRGTEPPAPPSGHAFNLLYAVGFAVILTGVTAVVSLVNTSWGGSAAAIASALAGAFDVHAAATSVLSLAADGKLAVKDVSRPVLVAFSTNAFMKGIAAFAGGGRAYGAWVVLGIVVTVAAAWLPFLLFR
jgi:uncharacterized membrane protein (DUF4010 family)